MFDPTFDPYDALKVLHNNIQTIDTNVATLIKAHNALARLVEQQGEVIDVLTKGLETANHSNQILMKDLISNMTEKLKEVK